MVLEYGSTTSGTRVRVQPYRVCNVFMEVFRVSRAICVSFSQRAYYRLHRIDIDTLYFFI